MIQLIHTRLLAMICLVMSIGLLTSCEKDDNNGSGVTELLSFGPTGANHGDTLRFVGRNLNTVTAIHFSGQNAVVNKADFKTHTSTLIQLIVPESAEKGYVTLKTPTGDIVTKTQLNLGVASLVTAVTDEARPGANVTLTGSYLNWVTKVTFPKGKEVTQFVSQSFNEIVVTVPVDAQSGPLLIKYSGTDSAEVETADTLKVTLPMATGFAPDPVKHADNVTITGTNLDLAKKVMFNGVANPVTTFVSQTATQLVVKVPAGAKTGKITLEAASGVTTTSTVDMKVALPVITTFAPNPVEPGQDITITGTGLDLVSSVTFQNAPAVTSFKSQSATQIVVTVPTGVTEGLVTLGVKNSTLIVQSSELLKILGAIPPPIIALPIYLDAVTGNWNGWIGGGWGGTSDRNNTAPTREGTKSTKINYTGGYGSPFQLGGANIPLAGYTTFKISVYGAPGSGGKTVTIGINGSNGKFNFNVVEGKWTDYAIPLSTLTSAAALNEIWVQEFSGTGGFSIYIDAVGLN